MLKFIMTYKLFLSKKTRPKKLQGFLYIAYIIFTKHKYKVSFMKDTDIDTPIIYQPIRSLHFCYK